MSDRKGSPRFGAHRYFYARPIPLADGRLIASMRSQRDPTSVLWTEMFESEDGGRTWRFLSRVNDWGAPGTASKWRTGASPASMATACRRRHRARMSAACVPTWGSELALRDDGGSWISAIRASTEAERGRLLAVYDINLKNDRRSRYGGVRHIARTLFTPD